jgi:hypothetical protein
MDTGERLPVGLIEDYALNAALLRGQRAAKKQEQNCGSHGTLQPYLLS